MQAVTFREPGEVAVEDRPTPVLDSARACVVRIEASGICGSDLHIYHGRVPVAPGFTIGHEFVGTVTEAGEAVTRVRDGDRVVGCFCTACGECRLCLHGDHHQCERRRVFGHGATLGDLQGAQAEYVLVPDANLTLRPLPAGMDDGVALFAGDVMSTGYNAVATTGMQPGDSFAVLGVGPVGLCAVQAARAAGAAEVIAIDSVEDRLRMAESFGATAVHLSEQDPSAEVKRITDGNGVDVAADCVGHPDALYLACRIARPAGRVSVTGVYAERVEVHMGLVWLKALELFAGPANAIGHIDRVLAMIAAGVLDPAPMVSHRMALADAPEAYRVFDRREALKIVLTP